MEFDGNRLQQKSDFVRLGEHHPCPDLEKKIGFRKDVSSLYRNSQCVVRVDSTIAGGGVVEHRPDQRPYLLVGDVGKLRKWAWKFRFNDAVRFLPFVYLDHLKTKLFFNN